MGFRVITSSIVEHISRRTIRPMSNIVVIDEEGQRIGEMPINQAEALAESQSLDLIQVSKNDDNPVYRIIDRGKWNYKKKKREKEHKQTATKTKEIKFHPQTEQHDVETKMNHILKFLSKGHDVRITVEMRGRHKSRPELAKEKIEAILDMVGEGVRQDQPKSSPSQITVVVHPK